MMLNRITLLIFSLFLFGCDSILGGYYVPMPIERDRVLSVVKSLQNKNINYSTDRINKIGMDINTPDVNGRTLLIASIMAEDFKVTKKLLKLGGNPNFVPETYSGKTALALAASYKDNSFLKLLLSRGADINFQNTNQSGRSKPYPIFNAIASRRTENIEFMMENGARTNVLNAFGYSPLMDAAATAQWEVVYLLLKYGADYSFGATKDSSFIKIFERNGLNVSGKAGEWRRKIVNLLDDQENIHVKLRVPLM